MLKRVEYHCAECKVKGHDMVYFMRGLFANKQDNREIYLTDYKTVGQYIRKHLDQGHIVIINGNKYKLATHKRYNMITFDRELSADEIKEFDENKDFTLIKKVVLLEDNSGKKYTYDEKCIKQYEVE